MRTGGLLRLSTRLLVPLVQTQITYTRSPFLVHSGLYTYPRTVIRKSNTYLNSDCPLRISCC